MTISGCSMVRNADSLYFPLKESILSVLPIVDEFIVALGDCSEDDTTLASIQSIQSDKIKIIHRVWSEENFVEGKIFAEETTFAMEQCGGDWCLFLQADEVIHENDLLEIQRVCKEELNNKNVDGFLFNYHHFWGDYDHYLPFYGWYKNEIRLVRNHVGIRSYKDGQSFRRADNTKLKVKAINAYVYHYGWVRPPILMQSKRKEQGKMIHGTPNAAEEYRLQPNEFDFGALGKVPVFKGSHPKVMDDLIQKMNWKGKLNYSKRANLNRPKSKHERFKYRLISFLEKYLNNGKSLAGYGYSNWILLKK